MSVKLNWHRENQRMSMRIDPGTGRQKGRQTDRRTDMRIVAMVLAAGFGTHIVVC